MISIEKAYYSENTSKINILLYNDEPDILPFDDVIDTITLVKYVSNDEYNYSAQFNKIEFDVEPESGNKFQCLLYIDIRTDVTKDEQSYPEFFIDGLTWIKIGLTAGEITTIILDPTELYSYKNEIINSETGYQGGVRLSKKLTRFSFYEQMLISAVDLGFTQDALKYYNELTRMSQYGIPKIKQPYCYL